MSVLGQLAVVDDDGRSLPAGELPRRARQVLAVLAARHGRIQSKDALADAVWGTELPGNHVAALEHYVSVIRRRLQPRGGPGSWFIVTRSGGYLFDTERVALDLAELRRLIRTLDALPPRSADRTEAQENILGLARELPFAEDPYADWAQSVRDEVQIAAVSARLELAASALPHDGARSLRLAQEAIELNPFLEPAYRAAMTAALALDRPDDALRFFERCRRTLDEELAVTPSADLVRLHREVLASRHSEPETPVVVLPVKRGRPRERFVGRIPELRVLFEPQPPKVVHIAGPHGAGKSAFLAEAARHLVGQFGIGYAGSSVGVHRLAWLRAALAQLGAGPDVLTLIDQAPKADPLSSAALERLDLLDRDEPVFIAVDDADDLDPAGVAELAWLGERYPRLCLVLTYRYPSRVADSPLAGLGTPVVLRLAPLTAHDLEPLGGEALFARTGGIPALVAVARRPDEIARGVAMQIARRRSRWMPEPAWDVLRLCAVLGDLGADDLARLTGRPVTDVLTSLDQLVHAHLLVAGPEGRAGHRSSLVRDAIAEQVSGPSRRYLENLYVS